MVLSREEFERCDESQPDMVPDSVLDNEGRFDERVIEPDVSKNEVGAAVVVVVAVGEGGGDTE